MILGNSGAIQFILYHVDDEFRERNPGLKTLRDESFLLRVLRVAEANGLLYPLCRKLAEEGKAGEFGSLIEAKMKREEHQLRRLARTLFLVRDLMKSNNLEFSMIKLYRDMPYAPRDVDILVRSEEISRAKLLFQKNGFDVCESSDVEIRCERNGLLKVDLYGGFHYLSLPFIDEEFMWKNPRTVEIQEVVCPIPSREADLLSLIIHSLLGHRRISLLDFLYAKNLMNTKRLDFREMLLEAQKHDWSYALSKTFTELKNLYRSIYFESRVPPNFPFIFSTKYVFEAFESFSKQNLGLRRKTLYAFSALMDTAYHGYMRAGEVVSLEIPEPLKNIVAETLFRARHLRGDRKA